MEPDRQIYDEQAARWNGDSGRAWVEQQALLDAMFRPFETLLTETLTAGERVLESVAARAVRRSRPRG